MPVWALSVENEPLYAPPTYSGMQMPAAEQAAFFGDALGPALAAAHLSPKVMAYDHNWDRPDYPETVLKDPKAGALAAGTAWHHYAGDPSVMTKNHEEFPQKDQWVTESSGGTWQKGNVLAEEAAELIAVTRNWARSYVLWALATDQNHGPFVGGCDTCRGLVTIDLSDPAKPVVKHELDYYVLGHASKFLAAGRGAHRQSTSPPARRSRTSPSSTPTAPWCSTRSTPARATSRCASPSAKRPPRAPSLPAASSPSSGSAESKRRRAHLKAFRALRACLKAESLRLTRRLSSLVLRKMTLAREGRRRRVVVIVVRLGRRHKRLRPQMPAMAGSAGNRRAGVVHLVHVLRVDVSTIRTSAAR